MTEQDYAYPIKAPTIVILRQDYDAMLARIEAGDRAREALADARYALEMYAKDSNWTSGARATWKGTATNYPQAMAQRALTKMLASLSLQEPQP